MNLPPRKDAVRQFWVAIRAGASAEDAVAGLGNNRKTGPRYSRKAGSLWFRQAGGVVPAYVTAQSSGRFLSFTEREEIHAGVERGDSIRLIAQGLGRAPSTVFHELRRNMRQRYRRRHRQGRPISAPWSYRPSYAQRRAEFMARRPKPAKLAAHLELRRLVQTKLKENLSPRQISVELHQLFPDDPEMWVSHETIYQLIYVQARGALRRELAIHLRTGRSVTQAAAPGRPASRPNSKHGQHQPAAGRGGGSSHTWTLGRRPNDGQEREVGHRHIGRTLDSLRDAPSSPQRPPPRPGRAGRCRRYPEVA